MPQLDDHHKKHMVLWASVAGTTAVVVALWAFVLPHQLERFAAASSDDDSLSRWMLARQTETANEPSQSFVEMLQKQRDRLNAVERNQVEAGNVNASNSINIDELRAKINSGLSAKAAAEAGTNSPKNTNPDAPETP